MSALAFLSRALRRTDDFGEADVPSLHSSRGIARSRGLGRRGGLAFPDPAGRSLFPRGPSRSHRAVPESLLSNGASSVRGFHLRVCIVGLLAGCAARDGSLEVLDPPRLRPRGPCRGPRRVANRRSTPRPAVAGGHASLPEGLPSDQVVRIPFQSIPATGWVPVSRSLPSWGSLGGVPTPPGVRFRASFPGRRSMRSLADLRWLSEGFSL